MTQNNYLKIHCGSENGDLSDASEHMALKRHVVNVTISGINTLFPHNLKLIFQ